MDNIVVRFIPFGISSCPKEADIEGYSFEVDGEKVSGIDDVEWCSLPDILLDQNSREFIGLSFSVVDEYTSVIQKLVDVIANRHCCYIQKPNDISRYKNFGDNDRLEIYWGSNEGEIVCEFASLYEGCWLYTETESNKGSNAMPYGYWLSLANEVKENYDLI